MRFFRPVAVLVTLSLALSNVLDPKYTAECIFSDPSRQAHDQSNHLACYVALFTYRSFSFHGPVVFVDDALCESALITYGNLKTAVWDKHVGVVAKRGGCSLSVKAKTAEALGFKLLLLANTDSDGFPVGPAEIDFPLSIPVLMGGSGLFEHAPFITQSASKPDMTTRIDASGEASTLQSSEVELLDGLATLDVDFVATAPAPQTNTHPNAKPNIPSTPAGSHSVGSAVNAGPVRFLHLTVTVAALCTVVVLALVFLVTLDPSRLTATATATIQTSTRTISSAATSAVAARSALWLGYVVVGAVFVALRLGTLRLYSTDHNSSGSSGDSISGGSISGGDVYNHRETDERVFEALVINVILDPLNYRLHPATIQELSLAPENYSDALFIHPPVFVYLSAALHYWCGAPLALVPLLLQVGTMLLLPVIARAVLPFRTMEEASATALQAWVLLSCCPVAAFCSQKFWIDNALMLTVTVAVAAHVVLLPFPSPASTLAPTPTTITSTATAKGGGTGRNDALFCLLSGLVLGAVGLNTKITALGLLPFSICWIAARRWVTVESCGDVQRTRTVLCNAAVDSVMYVSGAALGYAPWAYLYWKYTGRLTPNAWPSATMLQRSAFVRRAVGKPWYTYLYTLAAFSSLHLVGMLGAAVLVVHVLPQVWNYYLAGKGEPRQVAALKAVTLPVLVLAVWPVGFLLALTLLGSLGSGFQSRFLTPMLPGGAVLTAVLVDLASSRAGDDSAVRTVAAVGGAVVTMLVVYSALHVLYYAVLYAPLFADLDVSMVYVVQGVLQNPYFPPDSRESFQATLRFMAHYGLVREAA